MPNTQTYSGVSQKHQGAVAGIREMQDRMRDRQKDARFRNWSTEPNIPPSDRTPRQAEPVPATPPPPRDPPRAPDPPPEQQYRHPGYGYSQEQPAYYPNQHQNYRQNPRFFNQPPRKGGGIFSGLSDLFGGGNQRAGRYNRQQNQSSTPQGHEPPYPGPGQGPAPQGREPPYPGPGHGPGHEPPYQDDRQQGDKKDSTLLQDILNGIGLDDDRILILGLILMLVNDKADTTLILALLYLLL